MYRWMNRLMLAGGLLLAGSLGLTARAVQGTPAGELRVQDKAGVFTPEGIEQAGKKFAEGSFQGPVYYTVVTVNDSHVPDSLKTDFEAAKADSKLAGRVFSDWARELAGREKPGLFALVYVQGRQYYVRALASEKTDVHRNFTQDDVRRLSEILQDGLRNARDQSGAEAQATRNAALLRSVEFVNDQLKGTSAPATGEVRARSADAGEQGGLFGGLGGLCCLAIVGLLGIWLIIGLIRAFSGGGGGFGGGGGGFGGFFPSLLGGLFGAAAGMYLYDSFFGGSTASAADAAGADPGAGGDVGPDTYDGGADAGGGDFGDAGGGDFGGGDFGGGDFGGGGGDFGGGDW